jgi:hypothetical protein
VAGRACGRSPDDEAGLRFRDVARVACRDLKRECARAERTERDSEIDAAGLVWPHDSVVSQLFRAARVDNPDLQRHRDPGICPESGFRREQKEVNDENY